MVANGLGHADIWRIGRVHGGYITVRDPRGHWQPLDDPDHPRPQPEYALGTLKTLEEAAVVERRFSEQHPPRAEYVLTAKGRELGPVLRALKTWGVKHTR
jgi:hypothetical protein